MRETLSGATAVWRDASVDAPTGRSPAIRTAAAAAACGMEASLFLLGADGDGASREPAAAPGAVADAIGLSTVFATAALAAPCKLFVAIVAAAICGDACGLIGAFSS